MIGTKSMKKFKISISSIIGIRIDKIPKMLFCLIVLTPFPVKQKPIPLFNIAHRNFNTNPSNSLYILQNKVLIKPQ